MDSNGDPLSANSAVARLFASSCDVRSIVKLFHCGLLLRNWTISKFAERTGRTVYTFESATACKRTKFHCLSSSGWSRWWRSARWSSGHCSCRLAGYPYKLRQQTKQAPLRVPKTKVDYRAVNETYFNTNPTFLKQFKMLSTPLMSVPSVDYSILGMWWGQGDAVNHTSYTISWLGL